MNTIVPVPLWALLLVVALLSLGLVSLTFSARALRDLFRVYWRETYGEDLPPTP